MEKIPAIKGIRRKENSFSPKNKVTAFVQKRKIGGAIWLCCNGLKTHITPEFSLKFETRKVSSSHISLTRRPSNLDKIPTEKIKQITTGYQYFRKTFKTAQKLALQAVFNSIKSSSPACCSNTGDSLC